MRNKNIFFKALFHIEEILLSVSFAIMAIVCFVQVVTRYCFSYSMPWSEELLRGLFVWSSCLGISLGFKTRSQLGVDAVVNLLPKKIKKVVSMLTYIVIILFCIIIIYYSIQISIRHYNTMQRTVAMRLPMYYLSSALPIGFTLTIFRVLQVIKEDFFTKKKDSQDEELHISEGLL